MADQSSIDITAPQAGLIGSVILAIGAGIGKFSVGVGKWWQSKDAQIVKLYEDQIKLIIEERKNDRAADMEQQKLNAAAIKENTTTTAALNDSLKTLTQHLMPLPDVLKESNAINAELRRRLDAATVHPQ